MSFQSKNFIQTFVIKKVFHHLRKLHCRAQEEQVTELNFFIALQTFPSGNIRQAFLFVTAKQKLLSFFVRKKALVT